MQQQDLKIISLGDIVKLNGPYKMREWKKLKPADWPGFEYGIVVEITSQMRIMQGVTRPPIMHPRNVSLNLYDRSGQLYIEPLYIEKGLLIPTYVDFHISELTLYKIATETGYYTVRNPPDYSNLVG